MDEAEEIGSILREIRDGLDRKRDQSAQAAGMGNGTLSEWEKSAPDALVRLKNLAVYYGVSADELLGIEKREIALVQREIGAKLEGVSEGVTNQILAIVVALADADRVRHNYNRLLTALASVLRGQDAVDRLIEIVTLPVSTAERRRLLLDFFEEHFSDSSDDELGN